LLADMYAASYPDDVAGMVLLDAPLPDTFKYEGRYLPKDDLPKPDDWKDSPERVDDLTTFRQAQELQGKEPRIPVTYIGAKRMELPPSYPRKEITAAERRLQRDFLNRFAPGRLVLADSPHYMEPAIPKLIAREVTRLITRSAER
jgi:pimeloyl-ACP methyl ester carboxylesterase